MMLRTVAMMLLVAGALDAACAQSDATDAASAASLAQQALAQRLQLSTGEIAIGQIEPRTWSDSNMGCGRPGTMALQVITEGYAVKLTAQGREYEVHVSGRSTVVCERPLLLRNEQRRPGSARGLDLVIDRARQDLAGRLNADPADIRLQGTQPQQWMDSGLDCPRAQESIIEGPVNGYRLAFSYRGRTYTYHSDLKDVRPCPAIESQ
jgi:hypothetical protein